MRRPITLRIQGGTADLGERYLACVELDGEMRAPRKRAGHQLEHEHETAGGDQKASPRIP
ncbi:hypothetical protein AE618_23295 [Bosea vaviloviae]|uniref:Uncharacterized protein n=1 Tax=Bosea vaviloviae TaxID=1526658 RepID=A0A0N1N0D7_9HYPH|nr:hypothetical protein AE618_23295 [Bosea vaviloviae]